MKGLIKNSDIWHALVIEHEQRAGMQQRKPWTSFQFPHVAVSAVSADSFPTGLLVAGVSVDVAVQVKSVEMSLQ